VAVVMALAVFGGVSDATLGGTTSARSTASAALADLQSGKFAQVCTLASQTQVSTCRGDLRQLSTDHVTYESLSLGAVTVRGSRALFVFTGRVCARTGHLQCLSNHDVDAATNQGQTFNQAYAAAVGSASSSPFILPLVEHGGRWFVAGF
jgi:hypothetical protein